MLQTYTQKVYFIGFIDEVRVWNRALNDIEALDAYNGIFDNNGLLVYLHFAIPVINLSPELLINQEYYYTLLDDIEQAKSKIHMHIYAIEYDSTYTKILLVELVKAKNRGVDVKVILDDGSDTSIREFLNNDIQAKLDPSSEQKIHAKTVLDDAAFISSAN